jgi:hypothetical protein
MEDLNTISTATVTHPKMNLSAIFAGWVVAVGIFGLLFTGGLAMGYSAFGNETTVAAGGIGYGTAAWLILTWAGALFVGGMFASWFDGRDDTTMGTMHGVTVWGLFVTAGALMMALRHPLYAMGSMMTDGATADASYFAARLKVAFLCMLLSLIAAAVGGWLGSNHIHRVYHLRTYARSSLR